MMLHWPNRTKPISSAICARRLGDLPISKADVASGGEGSQMHPFIWVSAVPVSEQQYEPRAPFRANHHRDVDGALGHPTCP